MKISIDKSDLVQALDIAVKAISTKTTIPILEGFLLEAEKDTLKITGNNLDIGIQAFAKCDVSKPGKIVVTKIFSDIIKKMPDEEIDLVLNNLELTIVAGKVVNKIRVLAAGGYPTIPLIEAKGGQVIEIEQKELKDLITKTVFAVSLDESKGFYMGSLVRIQNKNIELISCDHFRIATRSANTQISDFEAIIHGDILKAIKDILKSGKIKVYKNNNALMFEEDNYVITARTLNGSFLDYKSYLSMPSETSVEVNSNELQKALDMTSAISRGSDGINWPVTIDVGEKFRVLYKSESGQSDNDVKASMQGNDTKHTYNGRLMMEAIKSIEDEMICMRFINNGACMIIPTEGDKYFHMVLPIRARE